MAVSPSKHKRAVLLRYCGVKNCNISSSVTNLYCVQHLLLLNPVHGRKQQPDPKRRQFSLYHDTKMSFIITRNIYTD